MRFRSSRIWILSALFGALLAAPVAPQTKKPAPKKAAPAAAVAAAPAPAPPSPTPAAELLSTGRQAEISGNLELAQETYGELLKQARTQKGDVTEAQAALKYAQALNTSAPARAARTVEAQQLYKQVLDIGTADEKIIAQNELALIHLRRGENADAIALFKRMDFSTVDASQRYLYTYNYGRALEMNKQYDAAYQQFMAALKLQPEFDLAAEGGFRVLYAQPSATGLSEASRLADSLTSRGQLDMARLGIHKGLSVWAAQPRSELLLASLLRYYVAARLDPPEFDKSESKELDSLVKGAPNLQPAVSDLRSAFLENLKPVFRPWQARDRFKAWTGERPLAQSFSALLKRIGDFYDQSEKPDQALARYSLAWMLDQDNADAALYAAATLRDHRATLDPDRRLLNQLTSLLFEGKGSAYLRGDWLSIMRFHTVLGTIFESDEKWGGGFNEVDGAIFQWEHAIRAEAQVRNANPKLAPSPGLHVHLGNAYSHTNRAPEAFDQYAAATKLFLQLSDAQGAERALEHVRTLTGMPDTPERQQTLKELRAGIDALRAHPR